MKRAFFLVLATLPTFSPAFGTAEEIILNEHGAAVEHHLTEELTKGHHYECISEKDSTHVFTVHQNAGEEVGTYAMNDEEKEVMIFSGLSTVSYVYVNNNSSINLTVHMDTGKFEVSYGGALFGEEHGTCTPLAS